MMNSDVITKLLPRSLLLVMGVPDHLLAVVGIEAARTLAHIGRLL